MVALPGLQKAAVDQVQQLRLRRTGRQAARLDAGRHDGVVIGHLRVVYEAFPQGALPGTLREQGGVVAGGDALGDRRQLPRYIGGKVSAVGARIGDRLVLFVEDLRQFQGPVRAETIDPVGVPLQFGEIVQQGRRLALAGLLQGHDIGLAVAGALEDRLRSGSVGGKPGLAFAFLEPEIGASVAAGSVGVEFGLDFQIIFGLEVANRDFALDQHRQRGRLHPADGEHLAALGVVGAVEGVGAGEVHPDEPVGLAPGARGGGQIVEFAGGPQLGETLADRLRGQRGNPQPVDRLAGSRRFVEPPEDQLAFAARIRGADDPLDLRASQNLLDHGELVAALLVHEERPVAGQDGKRRTAPGLPRRIDLVGFRQMHQVPDGPRDDQARAREVALPALRRAKHLRDVAGHGRFLSDDGAHGDGWAATSGRLHSSAAGPEPLGIPAFRAATPTPAK